jgi:hypothetical protein
MSKNNFIGKWYISEMEMWDKDYIDAEVRGYILFNEDGSGEFQFGYVHGSFNYQDIKNVNKNKIDFFWEGNDEMDYISGKCNCKIVGNNIAGNIIIDNGDSSIFTAIK